jgi:hypothetical protein
MEKGLKMDYRLAADKIYSGISLNPACFNFSEAEARTRKLWVDSRPMPTHAELEAALVGSEKPAMVTEAYNAMVTDVYDQMEVVFGTRNDASATAFAATFEAMLKRPESYVDETLGFVDAAAVTAYATAKIATSDAYGVYRMKRIAQFETEKAAILAGE